MANQILADHTASAAMTITLAGLASSTVGVGRQTTLINNTDIAQMVRVYYKVTTGTSPTVNRTIQFYLLTADVGSSPNIATDNAGASDAAHTIVTASLVHVIPVTATSDVTYKGSFLIRNPGISWGITVVHDTAVNLNATAGNHAIYYVVENQQIA
jgi:hypothetical protein